MEAEALHDFVPVDPTSELAFNKGDILLILDYGEQTSWYNARMNGQTGIVPGNYIEVKKVDWYMGRIARVRAEHILQDAHEGAFLVRLSESSPHDFSLSVKCGNSVQHFRILKNDEHKYLLWTTAFNSLNDLVQYYRNESVSRNSKILLRDSSCAMPCGKYIVVAKYDFEPQEEEGETELGFKKGDLITVEDDSDENWWGGRIGDRVGFFPKTYVQRQTDSTPFRR